MTAQPALLDIARLTTALKLLTVRRIRITTGSITKMVCPRCISGRFDSTQLGYPMKSTSVILAATILGLGGCASEAPIPTTHHVSTQKKLKSAHHWDLLATDTAKQVKTSLTSLGLGSSVTVRAVQTEGAFHTGFRNFMITRLVTQGVPVAQRDGEFEVLFETQVVRQPSPRNATIPGTLTALTTGVLVARNAHAWSATAQGMGALALAGALDVASGRVSGMTQTEVIITTSLLRNGQYLSRKTDVYYIEDEDGSIFEGMREMKEWRVV